MHTAASLVSPSPPGRGQGEGKVGSLLSAIDRYYSWPCDRRKMSFKPFARWAKYDFDKWLLRAADIQSRDCEGAVCIDPAYHGQNFQHPHAEFTDRPVHLQDAVALLPDCLVASLPPAPKTRIRDVRDRATAQAIANQSRAREEAVDPVVGILRSLDDAYRVMLLRASFKDKDAIREAVCTLPIWWPLIALPTETRDRIDHVTDVPLSSRRPGDDAKIARAKVQMFLAELRRSPIMEPVACRSAARK